MLTKSRFPALHFSTWQEAEFIKNEAEEEINPSAFPLNVFLTILCPSDGPSSDKPPPVSQACMPDLSSGEHMTLFDPHSPGLPSLTLQCPIVDDGFHNEHRVPLNIHVCLLVLSCLCLATRCYLWSECIPGVHGSQI